MLWGVVVDHESAGGIVGCCGVPHGAMGVLVGCLEVQVSGGYGAAPGSPSRLPAPTMP